MHCHNNHSCPGREGRVLKTMSSAAVPGPTQPEVLSPAQTLPRGHVSGCTCRACSSQYSVPRSTGHLAAYCTCPGPSRTPQCARGSMCHSCLHMRPRVMTLLQETGAMFNSFFKNNSSRRACLCCFPEGRNGCLPHRKA